MTNSFVTYDSQPLTSTPGMPFIGNYGLRGLLIFVQNPRKLSWIWHLHATDLASPFPKGPAGHFTPANTVVVANSNIFASNAVPSTKPTNAQPLINSVPLSPRMVQVLHSWPVTRIKVDRLECLLHGYPASLQEYLVSGFSCGFRINFVVERHIFESLNLKSALKQPQIIVSKLNKERDAGRTVGPFSEPPFKNLLFPVRNSSQEGSLRISSYTSFVLSPRLLC